MDEEKTVEWLLAESREVGNRITTLIVAGERILAAGTTILAAGATVAIGGDKPYLLMGLPFAVAILVTYNLFLNNEAMALGGYKAAIETDVARRVGTPIVLWESEVAKLRHNLVQVVSVLGLLGVAYAGSTMIAINEAVQTFEKSHWGYDRAVFYLIGTVVSVLLGGLAVGACLVAQERTRRKVHRHVEARLREGCPASLDADGQPQVPDPRH